MGTRRTYGWAVLIAVAATLLLVAQPSAKSASTDWPQFRGANRDGISSETGLLASWPESGPKELWRRPLGGGFSGISVVGNRLYTLYSGDNDGEASEFAAAFDIKTGNEIWRTPLGKEYEDTFGNGPRSTPTVAGGSLFAINSHGDMAALATKNGAEQWSVSFTETFGSTVPTFGFSTSALVDGNQVFVEGGGPEGKGMAALDTKSGEVKWTAGSAPEDGPGYNSPLHVEIGGKRCYVHVLGDKMMCISDKGKELWSHPWTYPGETHAMPIFVAPDKIYASGAEGVGASLVKISAAGAEEIWKTRLMKNHFSSSVLHDGHFYGFDNATLRCISAETGEPVWAKRGLGKGSLIYADGHLLVLSDKGTLVQVKASPDGYTETGRVQALEGRCWTAPTLSDGKLYLRNHDEMVAYDLKR